MGHTWGAMGVVQRVPAMRPLLDGAERADSWATDGHKWLNVPYDSGYAFVAHPEHHRAAMEHHASYLVHAADARDQLDWTPDHSRRARGFATWAALRELGRDGISDLVTRCCTHAARIVTRSAALPIETSDVGTARSTMARPLPRPRTSHGGKARPALTPSLRRSMPRVSRSYRHHLARPALHADIRWQLARLLNTTFERAVAAAARVLDRRPTHDTHVITAAARAHVPHGRRPRDHPHLLSIDLRTSQRFIFSAMPGVPPHCSGISARTHGSAAMRSAASSRARHGATAPDRRTRKATMRSNLKKKKKKKPTNKTRGPKKTKTNPPKRHAVSGQELESPGSRGDQRMRRPIGDGYLPTAVGPRPRHGLPAQQ